VRLIKSYPEALLFIQALGYIFSLAFRGVGKDRDSKFEVRSSRFVLCHCFKINPSRMSLLRKRCKHCVILKEVRLKDPNPSLSLRMTANKFMTVSEFILSVV